MAIVVVEDVEHDRRRIVAALREALPNEMIVDFESPRALFEAIRSGSLDSKKVKLVVTDIFMLGSYRGAEDLARLLASQGHSLFDFLRPDRGLLAGIPLIAFSRFVRRFSDASEGSTDAGAGAFVRRKIEETMTRLGDANIPLVSKWNSEDGADDALDVLIRVINEKLGERSVAAQ